MGEVVIKGTGESVPTNGKAFKQKKIWWRVLLAFLGGFLTCIGVIVGGALITGTVLHTKDVINMIPGMSAEEYIGLEYQNMTILQLVQSLTTSKFDTLEDFNRVSPQVEKLFKDINKDYVNQYFKFEFNWDDARYKPFEKKDNYGEKPYTIDTSATLPEYLENTIYSDVKLANFFNFAGGSADSLIKLFLYDIQRDPDTGKPLRDGEGNLVLGDAYSLGMFLNKYTEGGDTPSESIRGYEPGQDFFEYLVNNIKDCVTIGDFPGINKEDPVMALLCDFSIGEIMDGALNDLTVGQFMGGSAADSMIGGLLSLTIRDLNTLDFNSVKFKDLLTIVYPYDKDGKLIENFTSEYVGEVYKQVKVGEDENCNPIYEYQKIDVEDVSPLFLRTMGEFSVNSIGGSSFLTSLQLQQLIEITPSSPKLLKTLGTKTLGEFLNDGLIESLHVYEVFDVIEDPTDPKYNALLDSIKTYKLSELTESDTFANIPLSAIFDAEQYKDDDLISALLALDGVTIGNLSTKIDGLTVGAFIKEGENPSQLLKTIRSKTLSELANLMNTLTVGEVMEVEIGSLAIDEDAGKYYLKDSNNNWNELEKPETDDKATIDEYLVDLMGNKGRYTDEKYYDATFKASHILHVSGKPDKAIGIARSPLYDLRDESVASGDKFLEKVKEKMKLKDLVAISDDSPLILQTLANTTLNNIADVVKEMKLGDIMECPNPDTNPGASLLLYNLRNAKIFGEGEDGLKASIDKLSLGQIIPIGDDAPAILKTLETWSLSDLGSFDVAKLKFNEVFSYDDFKDDAIMRELWGDPETGGDFAITEITTKIKNVKLVTVLGDDLFDKSVYRKTLDTEIKANKSYFTYDSVGGKYNKVDEPVASDLADYYEHYKVKASWWFLLTPETDYEKLGDGKYHYRPDGATTDKEQFIYDNLSNTAKGYSMDSLNDLTANMEFHMKNEIIRNLVEAGFITVTGNLDGHITIPYIFTDPVAIGDHTITELLNIIMTYIVA